MSWAISLMILLLFAMLGLVLIIRAWQLRTGSGLPKGDVIYEDVSGWARKPLYSQKLGLTGKPDYLLRDPQGNLIPVEVKASAVPRSGQPYKSHLLQLAAYFILVEDSLDGTVPYGLIHYRDRTCRIVNSTALRAELVATIAHMRRLLPSVQVHRNHQQPRRCARCSMAYVCDERLA
jgi:CRISPR-associated exonuclease Cas4